jgi:hypothetical protein
MLKCLPRWRMRQGSLHRNRGRTQQFAGGVRDVRGNPLAARLKRELFLTAN